MGVADIGSIQYPFLEKEVALIKSFVAEDRAMLGLCLGAQLLAHAAGAKVYRNAIPSKTPDTPAVETPEFGFKPVSFPFPGGTEPIVYGMHDGAMMFHWHRDTFDLPKLPAPAAAPGAVPGPPPPTGSALLSSTRECKNQAFRFKNRLIGFQYHFEMTMGRHRSHLPELPGRPSRRSGRERRADSERCRQTLSAIRPAWRPPYWQHHRLSEACLIRASA